MDEQTQLENKISHLTRDDLKLAEFLKKYLELGGVAWKAYKALHPNVTDESAHQLGYRLLRKIDIAELMEAMGVSDRALVNLAVAGAAKATKMEVVEDYGKDGAKLEERPDYAVRHRYIETLLKLKKRLVPPSPNANNTQVNVENATIQVVSYGDQPTATVITDIKEVSPSGESNNL